MARVARTVVRLAEKSLSTSFGNWREVLYSDGRTPTVALVYGDVSDRDHITCRIQSHCLSSFVFNSIECDCREQMMIAQRLIKERGAGAIIWLDQEGRGYGHLACMLASDLSVAAGIPETEAYRRLGYGADSRSYMAAAQVLNDLGVASVELLSNSPDKARALESHGIRVVVRKEIVVDPQSNDSLMRVYIDKQLQGHTINLPALPE
jgi:GTP cyclohydrolase II